MIGNFSHRSLYCNRFLSGTDLKSVPGALGILGARVNARGQSKKFEDITLTPSIPECRGQSKISGEILILTPRVFL